MERHSSGLYLIICFLCILFSQSVSAYTLKGKITDGETNSGLGGVQITVLDDSLAVISRAVSSDNGVFAIQGIHAPLVSLSTESEEYSFFQMKVYGNGEDIIDIGTILLRKKAEQLDEVIVSGQRIIRTANKITILPSTAEIETSATALTLLQNLSLNMPGLEVNEELQTITIENREPILKIEGKTADISRILGLNVENIQRIEYYGDQDIRYNNCIINIVLKPRSEGGAVAANLMTAVSTGLINSNVGASYNTGKSEWSISYSINHRDFNKRYVSSDGLFIGGGHAIRRVVEGLPSKFGYTTNSVMAGYTYSFNHKTMFALTLGLTLHCQRVDDRTLTIEEIAVEKSIYNNLTRRKSDFKTPSIDIFIS